MVTAVQNFQIFPPKDLEKYQAPKIRMRRFFFLEKSKFYYFHANLCLFFLFFPPKNL